MSKQITLITDVLSDDYEVVEVESVLDWIIERFPVKPDGLRIYYEAVADSNEITPHCEADFAKVEECPGPFYVVIFPGAIPIWVVYAAYAILVVSLVAVALMVKKSPAIAAGTNTGSSNNSLSDRQNSARPNERIPDIYGAVISIPDLIALPYKIFLNNVEVEYSYMCIGRGYFAIVAGDILDDATPINQIDGSSVEIYAPFTSPNSGSPQLLVGTAISTPVKDIVRYTSVNGQTLPAPDSNKLTANFYFDGEGVNKITSVGGIDFTQYYHAGDSLQISGSSVQEDPDFGTSHVSLDGTYVINVVTTGYLTLVNPAAVNSNWNLVDHEAALGSGATLDDTTPLWIGPFIIPDHVNEVWFNVVSDALYSQDQNGTYGVTVNMTIGITPLNDDLTPAGTETQTNVSISGTGGIDTGEKGITYQIGATLTGHKQSVRMIRTTNRIVIANGNASDTVKWRDLYGMNPVSLTDFGDVTTVQSVTYATEGALAVKDRKLNMKVIRKIPILSGGSFTSTLYPVTDVSDIISAMALDPLIGARQLNELDLTSIYNYPAQIQSYFGTADCIAFCYTFDDSNTSFEEMVGYAAQASFCTAYRLGNLIKLTNEIKTPAVTMLFNHRNKLPDSETRSIRFGSADDNDGINFKWISPDDGSEQIQYIPIDKSATNPKEIQSVGVRNQNQAWMQAWRAYQKLKYQNTATQFTATQEAQLLGPGDCIMVADNTRTGTYDGEILDGNGLVLTLSQPFNASDAGAGSHTLYIWLQLYDGTTQTLTFTSVDDTHILLSAGTRVPLVISGYQYARATYQIVWDTKPRLGLFYVQTKETQDQFSSVVTASIYDDRYYDHDQDYVIGGIIP